GRRAACLEKSAMERSCLGHKARFPMQRSIVSAAFFAILLASVACGPAQSMDPGPSTPVVEYVQRQEILTPLPLRVRLPRSTGTEHVVVLVRTWGSHGWKG